MSTPPTPAELVAGLVAFLAPGEPLTLPHGLAVALAADAPAQAPADYGTAPGGDFTAGDLRARYHRSASWVRERMAAGDFGDTYRQGREPVARRESVLAYDERQRAGRAPDPGANLHEGRRSPRRGDAGLSLVERRARGAAA